MIYDRDLVRAEQQDIAELEQIRIEHDRMTRLQRIRYLGKAVNLSNRSARIEGMIQARRQMYAFPRYDEEPQLADDTATDTL